MWFKRGSKFDANYPAKWVSFRRKLTAISKFEVPVLDASATATLSRLWGREGIERHLASIGIDFDALLKGWAAGGDEYGEQAGDVDTTTEHAERRQEIAKWLESPRNGGIMALIGLLLSIYQITALYMPSLVPSNSPESPQMAQMLEAQKALAAQIEKLSEKIIEQLAKDGDAPLERVVRDRLAIVRTRPVSGSSIVTKIFPNQVVTVLDEDGKWIKIRYYDYVHEEFYEGWALKKYFARIEPRHAATTTVNLEGQNAE